METHAVDHSLYSLCHGHPHIAIHPKLLMDWRRVGKKLKGIKWVEGVRGEGGVDKGEENAYYHSALDL